MNSLSDHQAKESGCLARNLDRFKAEALAMANVIKKIGKDDPRRIVHSMKVGLALTLVSLLYYYRPLYDGFGEAGMWAILTVVVVFEFTAGGTLSKSLNRGCATLAAAVLGLGAEYLSSLGGDEGAHVIIGILVFILAASATFTLFFPNVRSRYDYGVMIFILTFSLVAVSGSRVDEILKLAHQRLSTILIGGATCIVLSIGVFPVWAGEDLHNLVAANIEKLAAFLDGFGNEFSSYGGDGDNFAHKESHDNPFLTAYKTVLSSKAVEESLANFAWWEPPHGRFRLGHPWKQYLKIGTLNRECATQIEALGKYLINSKPQQISISPEFHLNFQKPCITMSKESSKALKELSYSIKNSTFPSSTAVEMYVQNSRAAADELKTNILLGNLSLHKHDLQVIAQLFLVSATLADIIKCIEKISMSVNELAQNAPFKKPDSTIVPHSGDVVETRDYTMVHIQGASGE